MKLFYGYSHKDEEFRSNIEEHLALLRKENLLTEWHDRKILPGSKFDDEIEAEMESADIILLLLSSSFLNSRNCMKELNKAITLSIKKNITVVPIVLRECSWQDIEEISGLMALPRDGKPINSWPDKDAAFLNIYKGIKSVPLINSEVQHFQQKMMLSV